MNHARGYQQRRECSQHARLIHQFSLLQRRIACFNFASGLAVAPGNAASTIPNKTAAWLRHQYLHLTRFMNQSFSSAAAGRMRARRTWRTTLCLISRCLPAMVTAALPVSLAPFFSPPPQFAQQFGSYPSLLHFDNGAPVRTKADWLQRRQEILAYWQKVMGPWPALLAKPLVTSAAREARDGLTQIRVRVEISPQQMDDGYLLLPAGHGPFPAVLVPYYEPETSIGRSQQPWRDFGYQLARRGFVTLCIGSPGGDARKPDINSAACQPLSFLAYVAANCHTALAQMAEVDPSRIGIVGHSYGGKWALFGACLYDKFACGVWSDPGIVFDEARGNVNYWEPWYLGADPVHTRTPGLVTKDNPRTGAYQQLYESGHDLPELLALMAPRPFLVSGGAEDPPARWPALNRVIEVYQLLGEAGRVGLTSRQDHTPTPESNEQIYRFFETVLRPSL